MIVEPTIPPFFNHDMLTEAQAIQPLASPPPNGLTRDEAIAIATDELAGIGGTGDVVYALYGLGVANYGDALEPLWFVVVSSDSTPHAGGPACGEEASCVPAQIVEEYAGAIVSESTRTVTRMLTQSHLVSPTP